MPAVGVVGSIPIEPDLIGSTLVTILVSGTGLNRALTLPAVNARLCILHTTGCVMAGVIEKRDTYERAVRGLVAEGVKRGEFARPDPALVTRAMLGAVNWTARWYRPDGQRSVAEIADSLSDYLVRGLVPAK